MDSEGNLYWLSYLKSSAPASDAEVLKRREALEAFLLHPEGACLAFPDLRKDLITFFSQSSNPFLDHSGKAQEGTSYEQWDRAISWAKSQEENK